MCELVEQSQESEFMPGMHGLDVLRFLGMHLICILYAPVAHLILIGGNLGALIGSPFLVRTQISVELLVFRLNVDLLMTSCP